MKKNRLPKKEIGMDDLAIMVQGGFTEVNGKIKELRNDMDERFDEVDKRFVEVGKRFDKIDERFDIVENKLIASHTREIENLRDRIMQIEVKLAKLS